MISYHRALETDLIANDCKNSFSYQKLRLLAHLNLVKNSRSSFNRRYLHGCWSVHPHVGLSVRPWSIGTSTFYIVGISAKKEN